MYTKPSIYRAFSIYRLVTGAISFLSSFALSILYAIIGSKGAFLGLSLASVIPDDSFFANSIVAWILCVVTILVSAVSFFFCYMDASSIFQFADLIEHDLSGTKTPLRKRAFVLPPQAYKKFGTVIFTICFIINMISAIILVIAQSIALKAFLAVPVIPLALMALYVFVIYITYAVRYKAFSDAFEVAMERDQDNPSDSVKESIKENKTGILRGWCTTLFVICVILTILTITACILIAVKAPAEFKLPLIIPIIIGWLVTIINNAAIGCFFDNLGMMIERKMIRYKLIKSAI